MAANLREELHTLAEQLSDDATWEDALERLRFRRAVAEGKTAADHEDFATDQDVHRVFGKYGVKPRG